MSREFKSAAGRCSLGSAPAPAVVRVGPLPVSIPVFAWGVSVVLHGGILAGAYFMTWTPATVTRPELELPRGDQAVEVTILAAPWPEPTRRDDEARATEADTPRRSAEAGTQPVIVDSPPPLREIPSAEERPTEPVDADEAARPIAEEPRPAPEQVDLELADVVKDVPLPEPDDVADSEIVEAPETLAAPPPEDQETAPEESDAPPEQQEQAEPPPTPEEEPTEHESPPRREESAESEPGVETGVEILNLPQPIYPRVSRRRGEHGLVLLRVEVLANGRAGQVSVLQDPGFPRLTAAAIAAVRKARFRPATMDGRPVSDAVRIPFRFVLE